ncbi:MAG: ATP-binding protein, partial [Candidatus Natronoplasma sp.]
MNALPGRKKILIYLHDMDEESGDQIYPFSFCQESIAQNVELSQNRVSKLLVEMKENGLIEKKSKRVKGAPNKRYVYLLTSEGEKKAEKIKRDVGEENIHVKTESAVTEIKLKDIENYVQGSNSYLFALNNLDPNGVLDLTDIGEEDVFLDREEEIELLKGFIGKDRSYNTLLIKGFAGVGKTRLVKELEKELRDEDIDFYEGRGDHNSFQPFFPFRKIFSDILEEKPEIAEEVDWKNEFEELEISSESFFNRTKSLLEHLSSEGPLIIFVDDLQWVDPVSLRFLGYLTHGLDENRVWIIGAYRDEETDNPFSDKSIEGIVESDDSKTIEVKPFDWIETRKLLTTSIGRNDIPGEFVDMVYDQTDGVPLFIEALTEEMIKEEKLQPLKEKYPETADEVKLPEKVKELYDLKFRDLNQEEKKVLQLCSCMEDGFLEDLVIRTSPYGKDETKKIIENLKRAKFLEDTSKDKLGFTYEMTRFAANKTLSRSRKKNLHEKLVENLRKIDEKKGVDYHLRLGKHLEKIERYNEAARSYLKGGNKAEEIYENEKAVLLYERALKVLEEHPVKGIDESKVHEHLADVFKRKEDLRKA